MARLYARFPIVLLLATATASLGIPAMAAPGDNITTWDLVGGKPIPLLQKGNKDWDVAVAIRRLDSRSARLEYSVVPQYNPGCSQKFVVEWQFVNDIATVHEGDTLPLNACVGAGSSCGGGPEVFAQCFNDALWHYGGRNRDNTLNFAVHGANGIVNRLDPKYHEGYAQYLINPTNGGSILHVGTARDFELRVWDTNDPKNIGAFDSRYGNFVFQAGMDGVFVDSFAFLYEGRVPPKSGDLLGRVWHVSESGWAGTWTRRDATNVFDAVWTDRGGRITAVLTISRSGNQVRIERTNSSDGNNCTYEGTVGPDGQTVQGQYGCTKHPGPFPWTGTISG